MRFLTILFILCAVIIVPTFSQVQANIDKADGLFDTDQFQPCKELLQTTLTQATTNQEKAEVFWRLSRVTLTLGDVAEEKGAKQPELLKCYEEGEKYADQAIASAPKIPISYYWKATNMGRWGQVKGVLNALGKVQPMLDQLKLGLAQAPEHADSFYVMQQLYVQVPGFPVSFGNKEYGVSLGRLAIELQQNDLKSGAIKVLNYDYYIELAKSLAERNWAAAKRTSEQAKMKEKYQSAKGAYEKGLYYEGSITLNNISDKEEALKLVQWVVQEMGNIPAEKKNRAQRNDFNEAKALVAKWSK